MDNQTNESPLTNSFVSFTINRKPHCVIEFSVKASPVLVADAYKAAIKAVAKETIIPGFRKGKVPEELIKKSFQPAINKKWEELIGNTSFNHCNQLSHISVLNKESRINFKIKSYSLDSGAEMTFQFESEPEVPPLDLSKYPLTIEEKEETTQENLDNIIHKIRLFFSKWEEISDRPVQDGDFVFIDLDLIESEPSVRVFTNTRLEVLEPVMAKWMRDLVIGMQIGETKEGISEPDDSASAEDLEKFTPKKVRVTLNTIQAAILPAVDDDLAQKVGAQSALLMKERLKILMNNQAEEAQRNLYREQISDLLLEHATFDIPSSLLYTEMQHRWKQIYQDPSFRKYYDKLNETQKKEEFKNIENQAIDALKLFYICQKILEENHISLSEKDLTQEIHSPLDAMFADRELANPNKTEEQKNLLMSRMLLTKAQDFLIDKLLQEKIS